MKVYNKLSTRL